MDEKKRKQLVDKLAVAKNFEAAYAEADRRWCVDKLVRVFTAQGTGDSAMEAAVKTVLQKAKTFVTSKRDFSIAVKLDKKRAATEREMRGRRVEVLYGVIASEPKLLDSGNTDFLEFIARRRYRTIARMALFVNPNGRGYFRYPDTCAANFKDGRWRWKVGKAAEIYWEPLTPPADVPIWMKKPPSPPAAFDPVEAVGKLFTSTSDPCEGNLLDCATTMNVVLMDSLLEARDPKAFMNVLAAKNVIYLSIVHVNPPVGPQPEGFFLIDPTDDGLFVKGTTPLEDLQVGDHVYIRNHQLYKTLRPTGSWQGEHALVTDCGNRQIDSDAGFKFMGHGMPHGGETGAIPRFYKGLLNEINTYLHRSYRLGAIFIEYLRSNKTSISANKVQMQTKTLNLPGGGSLTVDFYFFNVGFTYNDYSAKPPKGKTLATKTEQGFVVAHSTVADEFFVHHRRTIAEAVADGVFDRRAGILFRRFNPPAAGEERYDPVEWNLIYVDTDGQTELLYTLYERKKQALVFVPLEMWELYTEPLARPNAGSPDVFTTRPKVDLGAHKTFLTSSKAL